MKPKNRAAVTLGRKGGLARKKKLTPQQRYQIAFLAAKARWDKHFAKVKKQYDLDHDLDTGPSAPGTRRGRGAAQTTRSLA